MFETIKERDVEVVNDTFIGSPDLNSPGIRARVVQEIVE